MYAIAQEIEERKNGPPEKRRENEQTILCSYGLPTVNLGFIGYVREPIFRGFHFCMLHFRVSCHDMCKKIVFF